MRTILDKPYPVTLSVTHGKRVYRMPRNIGILDRQRIENPRVVGSIPTPATIFLDENSISRFPRTPKISVTLLSHTVLRL
jgi:hypothetical protein